MVSQRPLKTELTGFGGKKKVEQAEEHLFRYGCLAVLLILFIVFVPPAVIFMQSELVAALIK